MAKHDSPHPKDLFSRQALEADKVEVSLLPLLIDPLNLLQVLNVLDRNAENIRELCLREQSSFPIDNTSLEYWNERMSDV
jgi:hypothetical protein